MARIKIDQAELEKRRMKAIKFFERGVIPAEVARRLDIHRQSASRWRKEWQAGGRDALRSKGSIGRKPELNATQVDELAVIIEGGAVASGFPTEVWTLARLARLIRERYGVKYHPGHIWRLLGSMGFSCQQPTRRAVERDEEKIRHWKRYKWPALKKKPVAKGV